MPTRKYATAGDGEGKRRKRVAHAVRKTGHALVAHIARKIAGGEGRKKFLCYRAHNAQGLWRAVKQLL